MFSRFVKYLSTSLNNQATFSTDTISFLYDLWHLLDIREDYSQPRPCLTGSYSLLFWTEHTFSPCRRFILFFFTKITFLILSITVFSFITFLASLEPMSRSSSQWKPHSIIIILNQGMGKNLPLKKVQFDYHYQDLKGASPGQFWFVSKCFLWTLKQTHVLFCFFPEMIT